MEWQPSFSRHLKKPMTKRKILGNRMTESRGNENNLGKKITTFFPIVFLRGNLIAYCIHEKKNRLLCRKNESKRKHPWKFKL